MNTEGNAVYDFSLFEEREALEREPKRAKLKVVSKSAANRLSTASVLKFATISLLVVASLVCLMLSNVKIAELNDNIAKTKSALIAAQGMQVSLNMQLEQRMSLKSVEDYAVNSLGLQKIQSYQITYINIAGGDKIEATGNNGNSFKNNIMIFINRVMEYFR